MPSNLILPPNYLKSIDAPLIFLAGPIQGAANWQHDAIEYIQKSGSSIYIASPRREIKKKGEFTDALYNEQVDWETHHLRAAGENGVVLFWLAKEQEHLCERAYAQTTRFELAEWKMRHERDGAKMVVGIEDGFPGSRYFLRRFAQDCPDVPILQTLEATCDAALNLLK